MNNVPIFFKSSKKVQAQAAQSDTEPVIDSQQWQVQK